MPDLAGIIEDIMQQKVRDEELLRSLEDRAATVRASLATAQEEIAQLLAALEIAVKRGAAKPEDLARLTHEPREQAPTEGAQEPQPVPLDLLRRLSGGGRGGKSLIDTVLEIIQGFDEEFTTADVRRELAERYPEKFASINPASIPGTVARLYKDYDCGLERVGEYGDGIHYRRKATTQAQEARQ